MKSELTVMVVSDNEYAVEHFAKIERGALQGDSDDQYKLAKVLLSNTDLIAPDTNRAHILLCQSAMLGSLNSKLLLASIYHDSYTGADGQTIEANASMAYKLFSECANHEFHGQAFALERMGDCFYQDSLPNSTSNNSHWLSVGFLERTAFEYYQLAALKGLASAQLKQALMYKEGKGTHKCIASAQYLLHKSAKQGYGPALEEYAENRELYT